MQRTAWDASAPHVDWATRMTTLADEGKPVACAVAFQELWGGLQALLEGDAASEGILLASREALSACRRVLRELMCPDGVREGDPSSIAAASLVDRCLLAGVVMKVTKCLYVAQCRAVLVFFPLCGLWLC